jgi:hypothetical protein
MDDVLVAIAPGDPVLERLVWLDQLVEDARASRDDPSWVGDAVKTRVWFELTTLSRWWEAR